MTKIDSPNSSNYLTNSLTFGTPKPKLSNDNNKVISTNIASYNKESINNTRTINSSEFTPQDPNLKFQSTDKIKIDNLKIDMIDIDGIDTNSKGDIIANVKGQVTFSKSFIEGLHAPLSKNINDEIKKYLNSCSTTALVGMATILATTYPGFSSLAFETAFSINKEEAVNRFVDLLGLNLSIQKNPKSNQYNIKLTAFNNSIDVLKSDINFRSGDILVTNSLGNGLNAFIKTLFPIASYLINPDGLVNQSIVSSLNSNLGLRSENVGNNTFRLIPEMNGNNPLSRIPINKGSLNISLDSLDQGASKTTFSLNNSGDIVMNIDAKAYGSSNKFGSQSLVDDNKFDKVSAIVDMSYREDGTIDIKSDSDIEINVRPEEKEGMKQQLENFGINNTSVSGNVKIEDVKTNLSFKDKNLISYSASGKISTKNLDLDFGNNKINLNAEGSMSFESTKSGGYKIDLDNSLIDGGTKINGEQYYLSTSKLKASGEMEYIPASQKPKRLDTYQITGASINAQSLGLKIGAENRWLAADDISIKSGSTIFKPANKEMEFRGTSISLNNFRSMDSNNNSLFSVSGTFSGGGKTKSNNNEASLSVDSNSFNINGSSNIKKLSYGNLADFGAKINGSIYGNKSDITINGSINNVKGTLGNNDITDLDLNGKVEIKAQNTSFNGKITTLKGNIGGNEIKDLDLDGKLNVDGNSNLFIDAKTLKLDVNTSRLEGSNLVINKQGNTLKINDNKKDEQGRAKKDIPAILTISELPADKNSKKLISDLKFEGTIEYDSENKKLKFNDPKDPLIIKSGTISDVKFNNFKPQGEITINGDNITLNSPASFEGNVTYGSLTLSNAKIKSGSNQGNGNIDFNSSDKSINFNGDVSFNILDANSKTKKVNPISFKGELNIKQEGDSIVLKSKNGSITGDFGNLSLKNFNFTGQIVYNQKTGELKINKIDEQTPVNFKGNLNGLDIDLNSNKGDISITNNNGSYIIKANQVDLQGKISNIDIKTKDQGLSGQITINPDGTTNIENLDASIEVEGVKLSTKGNLKTNDNGYEINLSQLNLNSDRTKVIALIDKIKESAFVKNKPESIKKLDDLKNLLSKIEINSLETKDLVINFTKDFDYSLNGTATNVDLKFSDIPERSFNLKNTPPNTISFKFDSNGTASLTSSGSKLNANINGVELRDFTLSGSASISKDGKTDFTSNPELKNIDISGNIIFNNNGQEINRKVELKADGKITMTKSGNTLEFESQNMKIDGMFSGFNVKSVSTENPPVYSSGKIIIREDGHLDFSKLKFNLDIDGINITSKDSSFETKQIDINNPSKREYNIKFNGSSDTSISNFIKFLEKVGNDQLTPDSVKLSIQDTLNRINKFIQNPDKTQTKNKFEFDIKLDENFGIKSFSNTSTSIISNVDINTNSFGTNKTINIDQAVISMKSEIPETENSNNTLYVKEGELRIPITDKLKESVKEMIIGIASENSKGMLSEEDLKDLKIDVSNNGQISLGGTIKGLPIVGKMDLKASVKVDGTLVTVQLDQAKLKGLFGLVQSIASIGGLSLKNEITEKAVDKFVQENNITTDYAGKNAFSFNLQALVDNYISNKLILDKVELKDQNIVVKYNGSYGSDNKYNIDNINQLTDKFSKLNQLDPKKNKKEAELLLNEIITNLKSPNLNPKELSMVFDKLPLQGNILEHLKENDEQVLDLLKTLLNNSSEKSNLGHIKRFIKLTYTENDGKVKVINKQFKKALFELEKFINTSPNIVNQDFKSYFNQEIIKIKRS